MGHKRVKLLVPVHSYYVVQYWGRWFWVDEKLGLYVTELSYDPEMGLNPPGEGEKGTFFNF